MRFTLPAAFAAALVAVAACGGSDGPTPTPSPDFTAVARSLVPDTLVSAEDLTPGWAPIEPESDLSARVELPPECDILDPDVVFPAAGATDRTGPIAGPGGAQVISFGAIYETEGRAAGALDDTQDLVARCEGDFKDAARRVVDSELDALGIDLGIFADIDVSLYEMELEPVAVDTRAYRLQVTVRIPGADQKFTLDVMLVREGRTVGAVTYAAFGEPDQQDETFVLSAAAGKLSTVDDRLPQPDP